MPLEGTIQNGVVILDPGSPALINGTRVEIALRTGMEPHIRKSPGVCGGSACIGTRRIAVWMLVAYRNLGSSDDDILSQYDPPLTREELDAAWNFAAHYPDEIAEEIRLNVVIGIEMESRIGIERENEPVLE
jgi:uncharacterized protein (DUF433 family)